MFTCNFDHSRPQRLVSAATPRRRGGGLAVLWFCSILLLAACSSSSDSGDGGGGSLPTSGPGLVDVYVSKGPTTGSTCDIYDTSNHLVAGLSGTNNGKSSGALSLPAGYRGAVVAKCSGGTYTDEATGATTAAPIMRGAANVDDNGAAQIVVTPLTELAVQNSKVDLSDFSTKASNIAQAFGLGSGSDVVDISKIVPTDVNTVKPDSSPAGLYGTALAGLSQLVKDGSAGSNVMAAVLSLSHGMNDGQLAADKAGLLINALAEMNSAANTHLQGLTSADVTAQQQANLAAPVSVPTVLPNSLSTSPAQPLVAGASVTVSGSGIKLDGMSATLGGTACSPAPTVTSQDNGIQSFGVQCPTPDAVPSSGKALFALSDANNNPIAGGQLNLLVIAAPNTALPPPPAYTGPQVSDVVPNTARWADIQTFAVVGVNLPTQGATATLDYTPANGAPVSTSCPASGTPSAMQLQFTCTIDNDRTSAQRTLSVTIPGYGANPLTWNISLDGFAVRLQGVFPSLTTQNAAAPNFTLQGSGLYTGLHVSFGGTACNTSGTATDDGSTLMNADCSNVITSATDSFEWLTLTDDANHRWQLPISLTALRAPAITWDTGGIVSKFIGGSTFTNRANVSTLPGCDGTVTYTVTSRPAGVVASIDASTGAVTLGNTAGTAVITATTAATSGVCVAASSTYTLSVLPAPAAQFSNWSHGAALSCSLGSTSCVNTIAATNCGSGAAVSYSIAQADQTYATVGSASGVLSLLAVTSQPITVTATQAAVPDQCAGGSASYSLTIQSAILSTSAQEQWATSTVKQLSTSQKAAMVGPTGNGFEGLNASPVNLPKMSYSETEGGYKRGTPLLSPLGLAASWDTDMALDFGKRIGIEFYTKGGGLGVGIGMNIARDPRNGRNYEYFGEDPLLAGTMAKQHILGVQSNPVLESAKHYVDNEQETNRMSVNVIVDERSQHEIHLLPFEIAMTANPGAVMCSYNTINGTRACESPTTLTDVLKHMWGFQGFVITDARDATSRDVVAMNAGVDVDWANWVSNSAEIQRANDAVATGVTQGALSPSRLDDAKRRELRTFARVKDAYPHSGTIDFKAGYADSLRFSENSLVLLKNSGSSTPILPLATDTTQKIVLIGGHADHYVMWGGGSPSMSDPTGAPPGMAPSSWTGPNWFKSSPLDAMQALAPNAELSYNDGSSTTAAATAASHADVAIVFVTQSTSEAIDTSLTLPNNQNALVAAVAATGKPTIVVIESGTAVLMPWLSNVSAVLEAWYPGIQGGQAIANILFGVVNPSGKLPLTFPVTEADLSMPYPGASSNFSEKLQVGYRWFDAQNKAPLFPFGFGLSYTTFSYDSLSTNLGSNGQVTLSFNLHNTGSVDGKEVMQVYAQLPAAASEPPQRLVAWSKVNVAAGKSQAMTITVTPDKLKIWDVSTHRWVLPHGDYVFSVGNASRDPNRLSSQTIAINNDPPSAPVTVSNVVLPLTTFAGVKQTYEIYGSGLDGANVTATLDGNVCTVRGQRYDRIFRAWCQAPAKSNDAVQTAALIVLANNIPIATQYVPVSDTPSGAGGYLRVDEHGEPFGGYDLSTYTGTSDTLDVCVLQTRDQSGNALPSYLLWEAKRNDGGLRSQELKYTDIPSSTTASNALGYIQSVNQLNLCATQNWRLPSSTELNGIIGVNGTTRTFNQHFFSLSSNYGYLSSDPHPDSTHSIVVAKTVNAPYSSDNTKAQNYLRLVTQQ